MIMTLEMKDNEAKLTCYESSWLTPMMECVNFIVIR
jgi:hypothetical protein